MIIFDIIIIFIVLFVVLAMFTQQDLHSLKRVKNQYIDKRSQESESSSACQQKSQDEMYISKYFLNNSFKILHIDIIGTEQVSISVSRTDSYMIYIIRVMTEDYSYQVRRRYSQFLKLYQSIISYQTLRGRPERISSFQKSTSQGRSRSQYLFPTKKISCSLRHFFNIVNKEKLAQERKLQLCSFLNQINNNYKKCPDEHTGDYIELLKFVNMKQQHQKYWTRKQGRILQISNIALKDSNLLNQIKPLQKQTQPINPQNPPPINIDHLTQCLQHQISKIHLAVMIKRPPNTNNTIANNPISSFSSFVDLNSDPMITDQIIKNVQNIKQIVLEMKRKINYDHIRCILKGKDVKHSNTSSNILSPSKQPNNTIKKGLIEVALKYASNQLVSIHILKIILYVFLNSECNYSSQAFFKTLAELDIALFTLSQDKQQLALENRQFREIYFKLVKQYILAKQQYGVDRRVYGEKFPLGKMMCLMLNNMYDKWNQNQQKNKEFKLKDDQKQWTMVIQNLPQAYNVRKSSRVSEIHTKRNRNDTDHLRSSIQILNQRSKQKKQNKAELIQQSNKPVMPIQNIPQIKKYKSQKLQLTLKTYKQQQQYSYILKAQIKDISYKECINVIKQQRIWNPILIDTQLDAYSNTRKDLIKIPEKPEKMFRFVERQQIEMVLQDSDQIIIDGCQNFVPIVGHEEEDIYVHDGKNPKTSTQTMPSTSGSCAHDYQPDSERKESAEGLASSKLAQKINFTKSPPREGHFNSYHQSLKIQRKPREKNSKHHIQSCLVEVDILLTQPTAKKYFMSEIEGTTQYIWRGFIKAFEPQATIFTEVKASQ